jgi:hypothetical protein
LTATEKGQAVEVKAKGCNLNTNTLAPPLLALISRILTTNQERKVRNERRHLRPSNPVCVFVDCPWRSNELARSLVIDPEHLT